jgi:hypothetical protein
VPTVIGALLASIGGLAAILRHRTTLTSKMPS